MGYYRSIRIISIICETSGHETVNYILIRLRLYSISVFLDNNTKEI